MSFNILKSANCNLCTITYSRKGPVKVFLIPRCDCSSFCGLNKNHKVQRNKENES